MKDLLRWIVFGILLVVMIFLFINLFNRGKNNNQKPLTSSEPVVYEKSDRSLVELEPIREPVIEEKTVVVDDTASLSTVCVFIGVFTITLGAAYIYKKKLFNH